MCEIHVSKITSVTAALSASLAPRASTLNSATAIRHHGKTYVGYLMWFEGSTSASRTWCFDRRLLHVNHHLVNGLGLHVEQFPKVMLQFNLEPETQNRGSMRDTRQHRAHAQRRGENGQNHKMTTRAHECLTVKSAAKRKNKKRGHDISIKHTTKV